MTYTTKQIDTFLANITQGEWKHEGSTIEVNIVTPIVDYVYEEADLDFIVAAPTIVKEQAERIERDGYEAIRLRSAAKTYSNKWEEAKTENLVQAKHIKKLKTALKASDNALYETMEELDPWGRTDHETICKRGDSARHLTTAALYGDGA